jgi:hypothetical protein
VCFGNWYKWVVLERGLDCERDLLGRKREGRGG